MNSPCLFLRRLEVDDLDVASPLTRHQIAKDVARRHGLTLADLTGPARARNVSWARQEAMALMHAQGRWSRGQVGQSVNRTSWTVLHGCRAYAARFAEQARAE